jgi:hypothetical protein
MNVLQDRLARFFFSRRGLTLSLSLSLLILLIYLIQMYGKAYRENGYDFTSYLLSSEAFFAGTNHYQTGGPFPFIYPLFLCVVLFPLASLPYWFSNAVWFSLNVSALYLSTLVLLKLYLDSLSYKEITALFLVPFVILTNVFQNNLLNGQVNFIVLLLCVLFLKYFVESRKLLATFFLSAGISIKITPLILIVYLIARREFVYVGIVLASSIFLIFGLPYAIAGEKTVVWYSQYIQSFLFHSIATDGVASNGFTFSITSMVRFLLPSMSKLLSLMIAGLISIVPIIWVQFTSHRNVTSEQTLFFSLYLLAVPLISPMSETHHLISLFPAASIVTLAMLLHSKRHWQIGILTLTTVLLFLITGKFYDAAAIIAIMALYVSILWLFFQQSERATAYNNQKHDAHII